MWSSVIGHAAPVFRPLGATNCNLALTFHSVSYLPISACSHPDERGYLRFHFEAP